MIRRLLDITNISALFKVWKPAVLTEYHKLNWLLNITELSGFLTRWILRLVEFNFEIKYKQVTVKHRSDAQSRLITGITIVKHDEDEIPAFHIIEEIDVELSS